MDHNLTLPVWLDNRSSNCTVSSRELRENNDDINVNGNDRVK